MGNKDRQKEIKKKKAKKPVAAKAPAAPRERYIPPPPVPRQERE
jgi:hypothetical protein